VHDTFGESGRGDELMKKYGIDRDAIVSAVRRALTRKKGRSN
jgi:transketolase